MEQGQTSGVDRAVQRTCKLLIFSGLSRSLGQQRSAVEAKVDLFVQQAVFVANDEPCFGSVLSD